MTAVASLPTEKKKRLAIVGSGIAGLACAYFLHPYFDIHLFEKDPVLGGHTHTLDVAEGDRIVSVDAGFMVFNKVTYPNLVRFFEEINLEIQPTDMSFSVQNLKTGLEWSGASFSRLFGQRKNLFNLRFWRFLMELDRFNKRATQEAHHASGSELTVGQFMEAHRFSPDFMQLYLVPMSAAIWSALPDKIMDFPARTLVQFFYNHGFLGQTTQHQWYTVCNGSRSYIDKILPLFKAGVRLSTPVLAVQRQADTSVQVTFQQPDQSVQTETFEHVILACHGNQAYQLLKEPTPEEERLLKTFQYQPNRAYLHSDDSVMPKAKGCWAAWNYRLDTLKSHTGHSAEPGTGLFSEFHPSTHYWMNLLQKVSNKRPYLVSLNPPEGLIKDHLIHRKMQFEHPIFDLPAIQSQALLPALNQRDTDQRVLFCGSYFKYGFHEDAFSAGLAVARLLVPSANF
jgi:uncharacterized protein